MSQDTKSMGDISEKELQELAKKIIPQYGDFITRFERRRYEEVWRDDRWEEEINKYHSFMKANPETNEMSPSELAIYYKEDGNVYFKRKFYRMAMLSYTEGIRVRCDSYETNASLYNNRAACHWYLNNYKSALIDSEKALALDPYHIKARIRAAKSASAIGKYDVSIHHCNRVLEKFCDHEEATEILNKVKNKKLVRERDESKKNKSNHKKENEKDMVIKEIVKRGIRIINCEGEDDIDLFKLENCLSGSHSTIVHLENGLLVWPVHFLYPQYTIIDFVQDFHENIPMGEQLEQLFPAPWDEKNEYASDKVNVYFEGYDKFPHVIDLSKNFGDVMLMDYFELRSGTPNFFIVPRGGLVEKQCDVEGHQDHPAPAPGLHQPLSSPNSFPERISYENLFELCCESAKALHSSRGGAEDREDVRAELEESPRANAIENYCGRSLPHLGAMGMNE